jgi:hypothetical protein
VKLNTGVFSRDEWPVYALGQLRTVERIADDAGLGAQLHLWPDKALGGARMLACSSDPERQLRWLQQWWNRISEWPVAEHEQATSN